MLLLLLVVAASAAAAAAGSRVNKVNSADNKDDRQMPQVLNHSQETHRRNGETKNCKVSQSVSNPKSKSTQRNPGHTCTPTLAERRQGNELGAVTGTLPHHPPSAGERVEVRG